MLKRIVLIGALIAAFSAASPVASSAQVRYRAPVHRVVVVGAYASPFYYYDPFWDPWYFGYYQWGGMYPGYPGYGPYRRYNLEPESSVRLEVKPKQAEVFVDGYYAGIVDDFDGTFQRLHLPPGEHEIALYLAGYRTVHQKVYLTPDNTFKLKYAMEKLGPGEQAEPRPQPTEPPQAGAPGAPPYPPAGRAPMGRRAPQGPPPQSPPPREPRGGPASAYGTLAIRVQPGDASISIDGESWRGPEGQERLTIEVPEGRHAIEIQKAGFRTYVTEIEVHRGETTPLNVSLRQDEQ